MNYSGMLAICLFFSVQGMNSSNIHRVIGQEVSVEDQNQMKALESHTDVKLDETVAVHYNGKWIYARVQYVYVPKNYVQKNDFWMGLVNWYSADPEETHAGQAINFEREVKKLPELNKKAAQGLV